MKDIIITDENFRLASNRIRNYGSFLFFHLEIYEHLLKQVCEQAIKDQEICKVLNETIEEIESIKGEIKDITDQISQYSLSFIEEIDRADQFLYGK